MKKLILMATIPMLAVIFATTKIPYAAANTRQQCQDITISNTGAGSINEIVCEGNYDITIECENDTKLKINVEQDAESGNATVTQNTTGGTAKTGDAVNLSDLDALIENNCFEEEITPTPTPTPTPPAIVTPPTTNTPAPQTLAAATKKPALLPKTGSTNATHITLAVALVSALIIVTSKVSSLAYTKSLK